MAERLPGAWLKADLVAGMTLAAYAVPVSMAYASLAGLPPHHGIYCYLLGGPCYAVFGTSRQLAIGPTSAIALLVGATVAEMAGGDAARWAEIAALTALVVAVLSVLAWLLRLSGLVSFISETILLGFKAGAALTIAMTQLPKLFGVKGGGDHFFERVWTLAGQLGETNLAVLGIGLAALALLVLGDKFLPEPTHRPPGRRPRHRGDVPDLAGRIGASRPWVRCRRDCRTSTLPVPAAARRGRRSSR